jgi:hypothetical protein
VGKTKLPLTAPICNTRSEHAGFAALVSLGKAISRADEVLMRRLPGGKPSGPIWRRHRAFLLRIANSISPEPFFAP